MTQSSMTQRIPPTEFSLLSHPFSIHSAIPKAGTGSAAKHPNLLQDLFKGSLEIALFYNCQLSDTSTAFEGDWGHPVAT